MYLVGAGFSIRTGLFNRSPVSAAATQNSQSCVLQNPSLCNVQQADPIGPVSPSAAAGNYLDAPVGPNPVPS